MDHTTEFIIKNGKVKFSTTTADGVVEKWLMRQPSPDEAASGKSAYRLMYGAILSDDRLAELAKDEEALKREAHIRGAAAEVLYMLPLLLQRPGGRQAFDVFDHDSLAEFNAFGDEHPEVIAQMSRVYWNPVQEAIIEAKKKSRSNS